MTAIAGLKDALQSMENLEEVVVALDMDKLVNWRVRNALGKILETVQSIPNLRVRLMNWNMTFKGVDDFYKARNEAASKGVNILDMTSNFITMRLESLWKQEYPEQDRGFIHTCEWEELTVPINIRKIPQAELMRQVSFVFQDTFLFKQSILDNIRMGTMPITFLIIWAGRNLQIRMFDRQVGIKLEASSQIQEYLEGIKIIKSCGLSGERFSTLNRALLAMKKVAIQAELVSGVLVQSAALILQASLGIAIFVGTVLITGGQIELLPLLVLLMFSTQLYGPILAILSQLTSLFHLGTVTKRMRMLLTTPAMEGNEQDVHTYDIELKNVTFAYAKEDVIKDVSLKIPSGSITALVGPSGSGKSTISKLIARFWDVQKGPITIGGENIKNIEPEHLMKSISFVFQDVTLFNDTVYNNIRVGNMAATEEQVMAAAKAAYCDEFVMRLSDGYQTVLGENGSTLSGGERQRISIARALLKDAPIILLDEATASLDPENEVLIQRAIARLVEGKTVIMIAHRLRTVVDADQIFVLENGKLVERGTHDELIAHKGLYEKLYHIQQESLDWVV